MKAIHPMRRRPPLPPAPGGNGSSNALPSDVGPLMCGPTCQLGAAHLRGHRIRSRSDMIPDVIIGRRALVWPDRWAQ
jgi:hypothetical protein